MASVTRAQLAFQQDDELGASRAFSDIWEMLAGAVLALVSRKIPLADVEDVVIEVFVRLYRRLKSPDLVQNMTGLVRDLAKKSIADFYRQHNQLAIKQVGLELAANKAADLTIEDEANGRLAISELLRLLPGELAQILVLTEYEGLKLREVADLLELTLDQVKKRNRRARQESARIARQRGYLDD